jgi:hypothetical protein
MAGSCPLEEPREIADAAHRLHDDAGGGQVELATDR